MENKIQQSLAPRLIHFITVENRTWRKMLVEENVLNSFEVAKLFGIKTIIKSNMRFNGLEMTDVDFVTLIFYHFKPE